MPKLFNIEIYLLFWIVFLMFLLLKIYHFKQTCSIQIVYTDRIDTLGVGGGQISSHH